MGNPIYQRIKERLDEVGLSDNAASIEAGLSKDAIRNIKRAPAEAVPRVQTLRALAPVLKTTVKHLIGEDADEGAGSFPSLPLRQLIMAGM